MNVYGAERQIPKVRDRDQNDCKIYVAWASFWRLPVIHSSVWHLFRLWSIISYFIYTLTRFFAHLDECLWIGFPSVAHLKSNPKYYTAFSGSPTCRRSPIESQPYPGAILSALDRQIHVSHQKCLKKKTLSLHFSNWLIRFDLLCCRVSPTATHLALYSAKFHAPSFTSTLPRISCKCSHPVNWLFFPFIFFALFWSTVCCDSPTNICVW